MTPIPHVSNQFQPSIYTRYLIRPEPPVADFIGARERQAFGKKQVSAVMFTDGEGYDITFRGARPLPDNLVERFKESTLPTCFTFCASASGSPV